MKGYNIPFWLAFYSLPVSEVQLALLLLWDFFFLLLHVLLACTRLGRCRGTTRTAFVFTVSMSSLLCFALFALFCLRDYVDS